MSAAFPWTVDLRAEVGRCDCGAVVLPTSFRDRVSWREFHRTRLCQSCQDDLFFRASRPDARWRYPIRRAVLAAPLERDGAILELALLPFICIVPEARVEWEARFLLRAGPRRGALVLFDELFALSPALQTHQVRLSEVDDVRAPEVRAALDVDLAIVRDAAARDALARCPLGEAALCLALADDLPWRTLFGASLPPPPCASPDADGGASVLRACALLATALTGPPPGRFEPLRRLVRPHRGRFPELDWESGDAR